jgi:hypothetical protein
MPITQEVAAEAYDAWLDTGTYHAAGKKLGICEKTVKRRVRRAEELGLNTSGEIRAAAQAGGIDDVRNIRHFWKKVGDDYSIFVRNPVAGGDDMSLTDLVRETFAECNEAKPKKWGVKKRKAQPGNLQVVDLADVHFQKLAERDETGYEYNLDIACERVVDGTDRLLEKSKGHDVKNIVFAVGNDILHTDNVQNTTTSGTPQDVTGSIFQAYPVAAKALVYAIDRCAERAPVSLVHCMSNHDWSYGWMLTQQLAAHYRNHPNVSATPYNISESHRKYMRFGNNLLGFSHGDGAKEEKLYGLMVKEARQHISECQNLYWFLHHIHHKVRKQRGAEKDYLREKDHTGMTAIMSGQGRYEGDDLDIEYIRSPSAPDGWHHRNGYLNRQGVESFLLHPEEGMSVRYTEWF